MSAKQSDKTAAEALEERTVDALLRANEELRDRKSVV
jgi:hypothetical protein